MPYVGSRQAGCFHQGSMAGSPDGVRRVGVKGHPFRTIFRRTSIVLSRGRAPDSDCTYVGVASDFGDAPSGWPTSFPKGTTHIMLFTLALVRLPSHPNHAGLKTFPTSRRRRALAWWAAKAYAETSISIRATRLIHQPAAGSPAVSCLRTRRLHAGERYAVSAGTVSRHLPGADARASWAPPFGNAHPFRELPVWQCSRRRSDCSHHRLCAAGARRFSAPRRVRTAALQRTAPTRSSASRSPVSRLN